MGVLVEEIGHVDSGRLDSLTAVQKFHHLGKIAHAEHVDFAYDCGFGRVLFG